MWSKTHFLKKFFIPACSPEFIEKFCQILQKFFDIFTFLTLYIREKPEYNVQNEQKFSERSDTMLSIFQIRDYKPQEEKPDVDDLIFGDDHDYVSTK